MVCAMARLFFASSFRTEIRLFQTKAAQERMEEMRQLISKRGGEAEKRPQLRVSKEVVGAGPDIGRAGECLRSIDDAVSEADKSLLRAASNQEALTVDLGLVAADLKEVSSERSPISLHNKVLIDSPPQKVTLLEKSRVELQSTKRQCELVKSLLADATAENEIMYEVSASDILQP